MDTDKFYALVVVIFFVTALGIYVYSELKDRARKRTYERRVGKQFSEQNAPNILTAFVVVASVMLYIVLLELFTSAIFSRNVYATIALAVIYTACFAPLEMAARGRKV